MLFFLACISFDKSTLDSANSAVPWRTPSDDPNDYEVDTTQSYSLSISAPRWVVPSTSLPDAVEHLASNNNVDISFFQDRLFLAWRSSPTHFAGEETTMWVVSSADMGETWSFEHQISL